MIRITASNAAYKEVNDLWFAYAQIKNTQVWFNLKDIPLEYRLEAEEELLRAMEELLRKI